MPPTTHQMRRQQDRGTDSGLRNRRRELAGAAGAEMVEVVLDHSRRPVARVTGPGLVAAARGLLLLGTKGVFRVHALRA